MVSIGIEIGFAHGTNPAVWEAVTARLMSFAIIFNTQG
jgi:hypothetical protein